MLSYIGTNQTEVMDPVSQGCYLSRLLPLCVCKNKRRLEEQTL